MQYDGHKKFNRGVHTNSANFKADNVGISSTGVLKAFLPRSAKDPLDVYTYIGLLGKTDLDGKPEKEDLLGRRMTYQLSHDFDNVGHISTPDKIGHTSTCLQIIDAKKRFRGWVMSEHTQDDSELTISAFTFLKK